MSLPPGLICGIRAARLGTLALALGLAQAAWGKPEAATPGGPQLKETVALYERGQLAAAEAAFATLARQGQALAAYNLAMMNLRGEVAQPSLAAALRHLHAAADAELVRAMVMLAELYENGSADPADAMAPGLARDLVRAADWQTEAARRGHVDSQVSIATAYFLGRGRPHDTAQALHWYRQAGTAGEVGAQYIVASIYERGADGVAADARLALHWYEMAARQGDVAAIGKRAELRARLAAQAKP